MITDEEKNLLSEFESEFPSETVCISFVRNLLAEEKLLRCHRCNSHEVEHVGQRTVRCIECRQQSWFTAGTIFERARKLKPFLALLWFQKHNRPLSSSRAASLLEIAQSSAWVMAKKIELVLAKDGQVDGEELVVSCEAFSAVISKRSRETPAGEHPRAEIRGHGVEANDPHRQLQPQSVDLGDVATRKLPENQQRILDVLIPSASAVHVDKLSELTNIPPNELFVDLTYLQLEKLIISEAGGRFTVNRTQLAYLSDPSDSVSVESLRKGVAAFIVFCQRSFHGTSRKYLQLYLSLFARKEGCAQMNLDVVLLALLKHPPISYFEIVGYVSPARVRLLAMT